jgi:hypothetical protein
MSNTTRYCFACHKPKSDNESGLRCAVCAIQARKKVVPRKSEPPTPQATPCRVWQGPINHAGYGQNGRRGRVHRWVWESVHGPIPAGMVVMHLCDNRPCFRLDHLRLGTQAENNADRKHKGRNAKNPKRPVWLEKRGEDHAQAKLTENQIAGIKALALQGIKDRVVAEIYGVSRSHISNIRRGKVWGWVEPADPEDAAV